VPGSSRFEVPGAGDELAPGVGHDTLPTTSDLPSAPGMPGMPMMPPMGGAPQGNGQGAERPDAAGLIAGDPLPWEGTDLSVGDPTGLDTPAADPTEWATPGETPTGLPGAGMPGMPMMPPMGGAPQGNGQGAERPDAAGLIAGDPQPWETEGIDVDDPIGLDTPPAEPAVWATSTAAAAPAGGPAASATPGTPLAPAAPIVPAPVGSARPRLDGRVGVVRRSGEEDFSAWDAPGGSLTSIFGRGSAPADGQVGTPSTPSTPDSSAVPLLLVPVPMPGRGRAETPLARYRRRRGGPEPEALREYEPVRCGGPDEPPPPEPEPEPEPEDSTEDGEARAMSRLLSLDGSAWGRSNTAPTGVLE
jgi:hypothetical protein